MPSVAQFRQDNIDVIMKRNGKSLNGLSKNYGLILLSDFIHLNDTAGDLVANLLCNWLDTCVRSHSKVSFLGDDVR